MNDNVRVVVSSVSGKFNANAPKANWPCDAVMPRSVTLATTFAPPSW